MLKSTLIYSQPMQNFAAPDYTLPFDALLAKAEKGDASAQFLAGMALRCGNLGCHVDLTAGNTWIVKASQNGNSAAQLTALGFCYANTLGSVTTQNRLKAKQLYSQAIQYGYLPAKAFYALEMLNDAIKEIKATSSAGTVRRYDVDHQSLEESIALLSDCIEARYGQAFDMLASHYEYRNGIPRNHPEAIKLYEISRSLGSSYALIHLGEYHQHGCGGLVKDQAKARELYLEAQARGRDVTEALKSVKEKKSCCTIV